MKLTAFIQIFIPIVGIHGSLNVENVSKVICSLSRFNHADIFKGVSDQIKLTKSLYRKCNIKVRVLGDILDTGQMEVILFAYHKQDNKETL